MSWESDIEAFVRKTEINLDKLLQETAFRIAEKLIEFTPVRTGFLRGSWFATINAPNDVGAVPGANIAAGMGSINMVLKTSKAGDIIYLMNNANYALFVNDGTSRFAGRRMVEKAAALGPDIIQTVAQELAR